MQMRLSFSLLVAVATLSKGLTTAQEKADRVQGAVYGAMIADALCLGSHYEFNATKIKEAYGGKVIDRFLSPGEYMGGQTHVDGWGARRFHPGKTAGDNTHYGDENLYLLEYLANLAQSADGSSRQLLSKSGQIQRDMHSFFTDYWKAQYANWQQKKCRACAHVCREAKATLKNMDQGVELRKSGAVSPAQMIRFSGALALYENEAELVQAARDSTKYTNRHGFPIWGSEFWARVVVRLLNGERDLQRAIQEAANNTNLGVVKGGVEQAILKVQEVSDPEAHLSREEFVDDLALTSMGRVWEPLTTEPRKVGKEASVEGALPGAVYFILKYMDFEAAVAANAMVGGDSASRAIPIGMVLGAWQGLARLPPAWLHSLAQRAHIQQLLAKLPLSSSLPLPSSSAAASVGASVVEKGEGSNCAAEECRAGQGDHVWCEQEHGVDYKGNEERGDLKRVLRVPSADACCELCKAEPKCEYWTWSSAQRKKQVGHCWLKNGNIGVYRTTKRAKGLVSGRVLGRTTAGQKVELGDEEQRIAADDKTRHEKMENLREKQPSAQTEIAQNKRTTDSEREEAEQNVASKDLRVGSEEKPIAAENKTNDESTVEQLREKLPSAPTESTKREKTTEKEEGEQKVASKDWSIWSSPAALSSLFSFSSKEEKEADKIKRLPGDAFNKALKLLKQGQKDEALSLFEEIVMLDTRNGNANVMIGVILDGQGKWQLAMKAYGEGLERGKLTGNRKATAHNNLGNLYHTKRKEPENAEFHYRSAIDAAAAAGDTEMHAPHVGLARVLKKNGKPLEAVAEYGVAAKKSRQGHFTWYSKLMLPYVYENTTDIDAWRERLLANLKQLSRERLTIQDPFTLEGTPQYFLSYHGRNDTQVYRQISQVLSAACPQIKFVASHVKSWEPPADGQRIKVGFCSYFFRDHSVSKMIMGLLEALDRRKFHVVLINLGVEDTVTKRMLKPHVSEYLHLKGKDFQETARSIEKAKLDVLVMAEIGMHDNTYALAHARLAPIQVAMHGHAQTSGVTAVDYFVSYAGFSEPDAQSHYSEMLVELPGLTPLTRWYDPELAGHSISKQMETEAGVSAWKRRFGIPLGKTVYACLQTLFKIDPTMDRVVKRILAADPQAVVVFKERQDANMRGVTLQLLERMRRSLSEEEMGRVVFLPTLAQQDYNDAYRSVDVVLDSFPFGGHTTSLDAFAAGVPVVTIPTAFMSGRCTQGLLRFIGIPELIANTLEEYIAISVKIGTDKAYREELSGRILAGMEQIRKDKTSVNAWNRFLEDVVHGWEHTIKYLAAPYAERIRKY